MSICTRCGAPFSCAMRDADPATPAAPCWCTYLPPVAAVPAATDVGCWCPDCLKQHIAQTAPPPAHD